MWWRNPSLIVRRKIVYAINETEKPQEFKGKINKFDTINEADKPQAYQSKKYKSISNESNKGISLDKSRLLDKSRPSQITESEDTVKTLKKSRFISSASLSDNSITIEQSKERNVRSNSPSLSIMSRPGSSIMTVSPDK